MNFNASKQWIKETRNQLNGILSVLYELVHSHCKGASIMYSNRWPSYCALSFQLFSLQWGLLYKLKPILSLVLKIIFLLKSNSRQVSCLARFFFVCLFTEIQMTKNSPLFKLGFCCMVCTKVLQLHHHTDNHESESGWVFICKQPRMSLINRTWLFLSYTNMKGPKLCNLASRSSPHSKTGSLHIICNHALYTPWVELKFTLCILMPSSKHIATLVIQSINTVKSNQSYFCFLFYLLEILSANSNQPTQIVKDL